MRMKTRWKLFVSLTLGLAFGPAFAAAPETLALADVRNNPERWPAAITVPRELQFQGGAVVKPGQVVKVVELNGADVVLDNGTGLVFGLPITETDFVARANAAWAKLAPAQREITGALLADDRSLWPLRVKCTAEFRFNNGTVLKPGGEYELQAVMRDKVQLYSAPNNATLTTPLQSTDVIAQARELVLMPAAKRPSRVAAALRGQLVDATGQAAGPGRLEETQVFALYYGASWCGPCRAFSPDLVKFINRVGPENPHLTVVMLSNDRSDSALYDYMQQEKMPWPAMTLARVNKVPLLTGYTKGGIPQLVIVDRHGRVLADSYRGFDLSRRPGGDGGTGEDPRDRRGEVRRTGSAERAEPTGRW